MNQWSSGKARRVLAALLRIGWSVKRESSSHKILSRPGWSDVVFAFHDKDEIGPKDAGSHCQAYGPRTQRSVGEPFLQRAAL
jgi:predicted RNA binding protein YcfA (HicA-like mRNA interferase family)